MQEIWQVFLAKKSRVILPSKCIYVTSFCLNGCSFISVSVVLRLCDMYPGNLPELSKVGGKWQFRQFVSFFSKLMVKMHNINHLLGAYFNCFGQLHRKLFKALSDPLIKNCLVEMVLLLITALQSSIIVYFKVWQEEMGFWFVSWMYGPVLMSDSHSFVCGNYGQGVQLGQNSNSK